MIGWDWKALIGWRALVDYINPTDATGRKDRVQVYALIVAGVVAAITAAVGLLNLRLTRRNLEQQPFEVLIKLLRIMTSDWNSLR